MFKCGLALMLLPLVLAPPARAYTFTTLYHFTDKSDGGNPLGGVIEDSSGTLYGETYQGGGGTCPGVPFPGQGCGTVYSYSTTGGFKLLVHFSGPNGAKGNISPVLVGNTLYGATQYGGADNDGVVFAVNTDGTNFSVLHQFDGADGSVPIALVAAPGGMLYGIAYDGGANGVGVLFSLTPSGVYTLLYQFALPVNAQPNTLVIAADGAVAGSTEFGGPTSAGAPYGCGTIFRYDPATARFTTLNTLPGSGAEGQIPYVGSIGPGPTIYGAETSSIFGLSLKSHFTQLAYFNSYTVGGGPSSGPVYARDGTLYGVLYGSITATDGLIYSYKNGVITDLYYFGGTLNGRSGATPTAKPIVTPGGSLIGTTDTSGNCTHCGTIWEYTP